MAAFVLAASGGPALAAPPPNDSCATAGGAANPLLPVLQLGVAVAGTTVDATNDPNNFHNASGSCDNTYFDVFYAFTPATTGAYTFRVCAADSTYTPNVAVYETSVDVVTSDVVIGCFNQSYTISGCPEDVADCTRGRRVVSHLNAGLTYYIAVGSPTRTGASIRGAFTIVASAGGGSGTCQFPGDPDTCFLASRRGCEDAYGGVYGGDGTTCSAPLPTPRDECSQADALVIGQAAAGSNAFAAALRDGVSTLLGRKDVYMSFTPASTGVYRVSTCGSAIDTVLSVHTGCPADWNNQLVANDNSNDCTVSTSSSVLVGLSAGVPYAIRIAGASAADAGNVGVSVEAASDTSLVGACCLVGGTCVQTVASSCEGVFRGAGLACAAAACTPAVGACCTPGICVLTSRLDCEYSRTPDRLPTRPYEPVPSRAATGNFLGYGSVCTPTACDAAGLELGRFFDAYRCEDGAWLGAAGAIGPVSTRQLVAPGIFTSLYAGQFASLDPALSPISLGNGISVSTNGNGVTSAGGYIIFFSPLRATFLRFDFERPIVAWTVDVLNAGGDGLFISTGNAEYDLSQLQALNTGVSVPGSTTPGSVGVIERGPVSSLTIRMRDDDFQEDWVLQPTIRTVEAPGVCCRGATCALVGAGEPCSGANTKFVIGSACNASGVATGPCCYADFDKLNGVQVIDIFSYLSAWFSASPTAKVGGDGVATPSVADIFAFLSAWFARC